MVSKIWEIDYYFQILCRDKTSFYRYFVYKFLIKSLTFLKTKFVSIIIFFKMNIYKFV